ncbi:hypothetical protein L1987_24842 [Smallanthus sonchifolius]|uniref:Uncharacterized protein n=1 Tax=Smallanthus sonchifolius TaxID=185202 RepID=A0ACB9ILR3_9ASTR|nr:hypothetical protein L1987_24842 [Smallanthus sonchifolius]
MNNISQSLLLPSKQCAKRKYGTIKVVMSVEKRFKIPLRVQDSSGSVSITLFASMLLGISAKEVFDKQEELCEFEEVPVEFNLLT